MLGNNKDASQIKSNFESFFIIHSRFFVASLTLENTRKHDKVIVRNGNENDCLKADPKKIFAFDWHHHQSHEKHVFPFFTLIKIAGFKLYFFMQIVCSEDSLRMLFLLAF